MLRTFISRYTNFSNSPTILLITACSSLLILLAIASVYLAKHHGAVGLIADDAIYLLMANYFSLYAHSESISFAFVWQYSNFPPLYPLLLSIFDAGSNNLFAAHLITKLVSIFALIGIFYWLKLQNINSWVSLFVTLYFLVLPGTLLLNLDLWSEHLYLALSIAAFIAIKLSEKKPHLIVFAGAFIGFAFITKSVGIVFVIAYCLHIFLNKFSLKHSTLGVSLALLPAIIWYTSKLVYNMEASNSYLSYVISQYASSPINYVKWLASDRFTSLVSGFIQYLNVIDSDELLLPVSIFFLLSLIGLIIRLKHRSIEAVYIFLYLIVVFLWPYTSHDQRFLYPIMPFLVFYNLLSLSVILKTTPLENHKKPLATLTLLLSIIMILPSLGLFAARINSTDTPDDNAYLMTKQWLTSDNPKATIENITLINAMIQSFQKMQSHIKADECTYSVHQEMFMYYSQRLAFPPPPTPTKDNEVSSKLSRCQYISVLWANTNNLYPPGYPLRRIPAQTLIIQVPISESDTRIIGELYDNSYFRPPRN